jgi:hypothetical protein
MTTRISDGLKDTANELIYNIKAALEDLDNLYFNANIETEHLVELQNYIDERMKDVCLSEMIRNNINR